MPIKTIVLSNSPSVTWLEDVAGQLESEVIYKHTTYGLISVNNAIGKGEIMAGMMNTAFFLTEMPIMYVRWIMELHQNTNIKPIADPNDAFFRVVFYTSSQSVVNKKRTLTEELSSGISFTTTGASYDLYIPANTFGSSFTITFSKDWLKQHLFTAQEPVIEKILNSPYPIELREIMTLPIRNIYDALVQNSLDTFVDKMAFQESVAGLIRGAFERLLNREVSTVATSRIKKADFEAIVRAEKILISNTKEAPSINLLASESAMSPTKFKLLFKKIYGKSVYDYYLHYRMEKARQWLKENELTVVQIGESLGYKNISHFSRIFKKHFGTYPSKYGETYF
jgi:AraC-like DNA-binding protein